MGKIRDILGSGMKVKPGLRKGKAVSISSDEVDRMIKEGWKPPRAVAVAFKEGGKKMGWVR